MNELDLFTAALSIQDSEARAAYLDEHCQGNTPLHQRLEELLKAYGQADQVLPEVPAIDPQVTEMFTGQKQDHLIGTIIAKKYKLLEEIGEGGMGTVFVAEQTEPVKRKVAVKLIKPGMDSKSVLARFEAERKALAMMDHPNIARVLDAGLTEERRPYFVMEYIKGLPLTKYCDDVKLSIDERLKLFIQICQAVQHAHQKGIIHRDLKPGNILIALYDGKPVPKVIDFGLAKALHQSLTERTLHTGHEMVLGTPLYMSPEQAELNNLDIDTRSDIYSLGVILYELLTGVTPLEKQRFKEAAWAEVLRIIKEEEPSKPSTKLSHSASLPSVAAQRQIEPKKLSSLMRGDLDWIVMKALEKDRNRRYETANGFAADVLRYLSGEAVLAHPPTWWYRYQKFSKRHRGAILATFMLIVGIVLFTGSLYSQVERAKAAERLAIEARQAEAERAEGEKQAKLEAEAKRREAEKNLAFAKKGNDILGSVFSGLDPKANYATLGEFSQALKDNLKKAAQELQISSIGDPLTVARMQNTLGLSLLGLGDAAHAIPLFEKALATYQSILGPDNQATLVSMNNLALSLDEAGLHEKALPLQEQTLKLRKATLGASHPDTLNSMNSLAVCCLSVGKFEQAILLLEESFKLTKAAMGEKHFDTLICMSNLAQGYLKAGKLMQAIPLHEDALKCMKENQSVDHPNALRSMNNLALAYQAAGKLELSLPLLEETLQRMKVRLGAEHPDTTYAANNLAGVYSSVGKASLALPIYEETLRVMKARLGIDHPATITSMNNLAVAYRDAKRLDLAVPLLEETLNLRKAKLGKDHPETLQTMGNLAVNYQEIGKPELATPLLEETLKLQIVKLGREHPDTIKSMRNQAMIYRANGKMDLALPLLKETLQLSQNHLGSDHPETLTSMRDLALGYWSLHQLDKSIPLFEEVLTLSEKNLGRQHPKTQETLANLGVNYKDAGRLQEAIPLLENAYQALKKIPSLVFVGPHLLEAYYKAGKSDAGVKLAQELVTNARKSLSKDSPKLAEQVLHSGRILLEMKRYQEAEPLLREGLAYREKMQSDTWNTFNSMSMLGGALLGQKKYTEAEPMLIKGYEGMKARENIIPQKYNTRLPQALDRLIQLYTETNKPDEVKKWQTEKGKLNKPVEKK